MMFSTLPFLVVAGAILQAQASPVSFAKDVGMTSFGPIMPGGPDVTLSGTAKSIYEQILDLNPNYNPVDFGGKPLDLDSAPTVSKKSFDTLPELEGRTATGGCCRCLGAPYNGEAWYGQVDEGAKYLWALGTRTCSSGASGAARLTCSYNSAVFMISTAPKATYSTCTHVGDMVNHVNRHCKKESNGDVNGELCDTDGFCIAVATSKC